jgi:hypothetical protein
MKSAIALSICLALTASAAIAQQSAPITHSVQADYALAQGPASPAVRQIEGLEVRGKGPPMKQCGDRDRACVQRVVAELETRYPEQLKRWCHQVQASSMMAQAQRSLLLKSPGIMQHPAGYDEACR